MCHLHRIQRRHLWVVRQVVVKGKVLRADAFFVAKADVLANTNISAFHLDGYEFVVANTVSRGKARLAAWFKSDRLVRLKNLEHLNNDIIVLNGVQGTVTGVYRPFKCFQGESLGSNFTRLVNNLEAILAYNKKSLIMGDLNVNWNGTNNCAFRLQLEAIIDNFLLHQLVDFETRFRYVNGVLQSSCLDLIITNLDEVTIEHESQHCSDHLILDAFQCNTQEKTVQKGNR